jgi:NADP-dependent 3-hydroxy acid dehydrogenase YdfG
VGRVPGVSASLARQLSARGVKVALAARDINKLKELADQAGAKTFAADAALSASVTTLFDDVARPSAMSNRQSQSALTATFWRASRRQGA